MQNSVSHPLDISKHSHTKIILNDMAHKPWEVVTANILAIKNNTLLFIVDCYSTFPAIRKTDGLSANSLIRLVKIVYAECGFPKQTGLTQAKILYQTNCYNFTGK